MKSSGAPAAGAGATAGGRDHSPHDVDQEMEIFLTYAGRFPDTAEAEDKNWFLLVPFRASSFGVWVWRVLRICGFPTAHAILTVLWLRRARAVSSSSTSISGGAEKMEDRSAIKTSAKRRASRDTAAATPSFGSRSSLVSRSQRPWVRETRDNERDSSSRGGYRPTTPSRYNYNEELLLSMSTASSSAAAPPHHVSARYSILSSSRRYSGKNLFSIPENGTEHIVIGNGGGLYKYNNGGGGYHNLPAYNGESTGGGELSPVSVCLSDIRGMDASTLDWSSLGFLPSESTSCTGGGELLVGGSHLPSSVLNANAGATVGASMATHHSLIDCAGVVPGEEHWGRSIVPVQSLRGNEERGRGRSSCTRSDCADSWSSEWSGNPFAGLEDQILHQAHADEDYVFLRFPSSEGTSSCRSSSTSQFSELSRASSVSIAEIFRSDDELLVLAGVDEGRGGSVIEERCRSSSEASLEVISDARPLATSRSQSDLSDFSVLSVASGDRGSETIRSLDPSVSSEVCGLLGRLQLNCSPGRSGRTPAASGDSVLSPVDSTSFNPPGGYVPSKASTSVVRERSSHVSEGTMPRRRQHDLAARSCPSSPCSRWEAAAGRLSGNTSSSRRGRFGDLSSPRAENSVSPSSNSTRKGDRVGLSTPAPPPNISSQHLMERSSSCMMCFPHLPVGCFAAQNARGGGLGGDWGQQAAKNVRQRRFLRCWYVSLFVSALVVPSGAFLWLLGQPQNRFAPGIGVVVLEVG